MCRESRDGWKVFLKATIKKKTRLHNFIHSVYAVSSLYLLYSLVCMYIEYLRQIIWLRKKRFKKQQLRISICVIFILKKDIKIYFGCLCGSIELFSRIRFLYIYYASFKLIKIATIDNITNFIHSENNCNTLTDTQWHDSTHLDKVYVPSLYYIAKNCSLLCIFHVMNKLYLKILSIR